MSKRIPVEISTTNKNLPKVRNEKNEEVFQDITVTVQVDVPETLEEGAQFYGSEEKMIEAIQGDVARRKANSARPLLRDAKEVGNWTQIAQQAVDTYAPGRKPMVAPSISEEVLSSATDMADLMAKLRAAGINIVPAGGAQEPEGELVGAGEDAGQ